jgi:hypothetical protein
MPNLDIAREAIKAVNLKFRDGCGNQKSGPMDILGMARNAKLLRSQREAMAKGIEHQLVSAIVVRDPAGQEIEVVHTLRPVRAWQTGLWLEGTPTATVGNCGERSYLAAHLLRKAKARHVTVLTGPSATSIGHDFVVIGATNITTIAEYSEDRVPGWLGEDIVICDPWYQAGGLLDYECGIAYRLSEWPVYMPKIITTTLGGATKVDRKKFTLIAQQGDHDRRLS